MVHCTPVRFKVCPLLPKGQSPPWKAVTSAMDTIRLLLLLGLALAAPTACAQDLSSETEDPFPHIRQHTPLAPGARWAFRRSLQATPGARLPTRQVTAKRAPQVAVRRAAPLPLGGGFWSTNGSNFVDGAGRVVYFSGVVWAGFETPDRVVQGLYRRTIGSHLDQMKALNFSVIRLPFSGEALQKASRPRNFNAYANPRLKNVNSLQAMDLVVAECTRRGMKIILDYHRLTASLAAEGGLWWDATYPPQTWFNSWLMLAKRYKGNPTIIGADLFNEVHACPKCPAGSPFWEMDAGKWEPNFNFRTWSQMVAKAIHKIEPNWIIFMEGMPDNYWWGGNVTALLKAPIKLKVPNKLAYSAHENGPYVYWHAFFNATTFPNNMVPIYRANWGHVQEKGIAPVWVGHFGSAYRLTKSRKDGIERTNFRMLIAYMRLVKASWTFAYWGPTSRDIGGLLYKDWQSVNTMKMGLLAPILHPNFGPSPGQV